MFSDFLSVADENQNNIDSVVNFWTNSTKCIIDKHLPKITKRVKREIQPGWMTEDIITTMRDRDEAQIKEGETQYKLLRNKAKAMLRQSKTNFYKKKVEECKNKPQDLVKIFNDLGVKDNTHRNIQQIVHENELIKDKLKITNIFNKHFTNISEKYKNDLNNQQTLDTSKLKSYVDEKVPIQNTFKIPPITHEFVFKYLTDLQAKKATGLDDISARFLKLTAPYVTDSIVKMSNISIKTNSFAELWKIAGVTPLHKKNDKEDVSNYRPISILPVVSKILEKHVSIHLYEFLTSHNLLYQRQSGFRPNHSCETALSIMVEEWLNAIHSRNQTGLLLVDLCKAFDLVNHDLLIKKLELYKCSNDTIKWFKSYLENRQQVVKIDGITSDNLNIKRGVPQGSILGPLLFIIFINDIFLQDELSNINLFADDAVVCKTGKNKCEISKNIQKSAKSLHNWCKENDMVLSIEKTKTMFIYFGKQMYQRNKNSNMCLEQIEINGNILEEVEKSKILGIMIDSNLSWNAHIAQVKKVVSFKLFLLRKIRKYLTLETRKTFYSYYIKPIIEYCCSIWGNTTKENTDTINKLLKKTARLILDVEPLTPSKTMFEKLKWLPFDELIKFRQVCLVYKAFCGTAPPYIKNLFTNVEDHVDYSLRSSANNNVFVPRHHHKSLSYSGATAWNSLPEVIKSAKSFVSFKKMYLDKTFDKLEYHQ